MTEPTNKKLYDLVKKMADLKFKAKTSVYKSSWIVSEYKKRGGRYKGNKPKKKGLTRWYMENWIDLNRPIKDADGKIIGYQSCGRLDPKNKDKYPLCRPSQKITKDTPKTYKEIPKKIISNANKEKQKVKEKDYVKFS